MAQAQSAEREWTCRGLSKNESARPMSKGEGLPMTCPRPTFAPFGFPSLVRFSQGPPNFLGPLAPKSVQRVELVSLTTRHPPKRHLRNPASNPQLFFRVLLKPKLPTPLRPPHEPPQAAFLSQPPGSPSSAGAHQAPQVWHRARRARDPRGSGKRKPRVHGLNVHPITTFCFFFPYE